MRFHRLMMWGILPVVAISALYISSYSRHTRQPIAQAMVHPLDLPPYSWHMPLPAERAVYPLSVIPGGVESLAELKQIMKDDREIARHLKDFDLSKAKLVRITQPRAAYVSYRIGDRIFWTTRKLTLKKGEVILTDGTHIIRGRCGNDISYVPMKPTAPELEFTAAQLDAPLLPPEDPALMPDSVFLSAYPSSLGTPQVPPIYASPTGAPVDVEPIASGFYPLFSPGGLPGTEAIPAITPVPTPTPTPTPEPMSFLLLSIAGIVIGVLGLVLRREKESNRLLVAPQGSFK
jgi:hypothetical protein